MTDKKTIIGTLALAGINGAAGAAVSRYGAPDGRLLPPSPAPPTQAQKNLDEAQFRAGVAYGNTLRAMMKNPDSFHLDLTRRSDDGFYCFSYRAANSFNAVTPGQAIGQDGRVTTIEAGAAFIGNWNRHCTKPAKELETVTFAVNNRY